MVGFGEFGQIDEHFTYLDESVFNVKVNLALLHDVIRWQLARKRLGTRKTKGISDIKATTRKPHRQKGTGRARQGSLCSPQFRGGAIIFGPVVRSHSFSLNKKIRKLAVKMALSEKMRQKELVVIGDEQISDLNVLQFATKVKKIGILVIVDDNANLKFSNDHYYVDTILCSAINVYSIVRYDYILLTHKVVSYLNKRFI